MDTVEQYKKQHVESYKQAVLEFIKNNTTALVDSDILSLVKTPPLDSMDLLKTKLLSLAKTKNIVLNTEELTNILSDYRLSLSNSFVSIKKIRIEFLNEIVKSFSPERNLEVIKITKSELNEVNKKIKKQLKEFLKEYGNKLLDNLSKIYISDYPDEEKQEIFDNFKKYLKHNYEKQLLDSIDIKILIKDRTLVNVIAEQGERYLFTKENSHIFD